MTKSVSCNWGNTVIAIKEHSKPTSNIVKFSWWRLYEYSCLLGCDATLYCMSYTKVAYRPTYRKHGRCVMVTAIPHLLCMGAKLRLLMKINRFVSIFCVSTKRKLKTITIWVMALQPAACSHIVTVYILYKFHNDLGSSVYHLLFCTRGPRTSPQ